jgi:LacI family transcriptional regulator
LRKHSVKIPEEVGVVGFCNSKVAAYMHPSLSSVEQYGYDIGKLSTDILLDMIKNNVDEKLMSKKVILEPKLIVRESSKRV